MFSRINLIKDLGLVFSDFSWNASVASFQDVNIVYGWNGCGKTTLTRLFDQLADPAVGDATFEVETADGTTITAGMPLTTPVRVFNQDYIQNNVRLLESSANTISLVLGAANQDLIDQIAQDEQALHGDPNDASAVGKIKEQDDCVATKQRLEKENDTAFTDIARTIGAALANTGAASRTYRAPQAKKDFDKLTEPQTLSEGDLLGYVLALKQDMLPKVEQIAVESLGVSTPISTLDFIQTSAAKAKMLCDKTVASVVISRIAEQPDISEWVETGLHLHNELGAAECEFCGNKLAAERLTELAQHFNDADGKLKAEIEEELARLRMALKHVQALSVPDPARLYEESREAYTEAVTAVEEAKQSLSRQITTLGQELAKKKSQTTTALALDVSIDATQLTEAIKQANDLIIAHNHKTSEFNKIQNTAASGIKQHYLSTIHADVQTRLNSIAEADQTIRTLTEDIAVISERIAAARKEISSAHAACDQINENLKTFLGRDELQFEPHLEMVQEADGSQVETVTSYRIMRHGEPAVRVSEGEKTALAFIYFVVHLNDGQFQKSDGVVVIDDPISSLDSNSLYQAFSFLKNAILDCKQVFILTHNFDFLKLLLNWRKNVPRRHGRTSYYMIKNQIGDDARRALIDDMDKELLTYESEYHYLFKRLKEMQAAQDGSIMQAYPVPNIARKVWDTFLMFQVPNGDSQYRKMAVLKADGFDEQKLDAIYKFTNDQSHISGAGFDPSLVPETQKVLGELFEMMEAIAPKHFAVLDEATPL